MSKENDGAALSAAKEKLVREGELYRVSVLHARHQVAHALRPDQLVHGALDHAIGVVQHRLAGLLGKGDGAPAVGGLAGIAGLAGGLSLPKVLPYAIRIGSFIVRRRLIKPALAVAAVAAIGGAWLMRRK
ncbi:hypothetical protein [Pseudoduganella namucuonensis]|uniref:Uncharacterized protein n=1 Tax=Pseudoduganella namucuonensis TaxID=1035707 RepID=A0A1I7J582_9BURK|nr:hypothetical protein [Pseudoduganella namucuonensis]SFU80287.1 hypothetical protein SAMN05216552_101063 [Pseudoduganella namucuonensis]